MHQEDQDQESSWLQLVILKKMFKGKMAIYETVSGYH